MSHKTKPLRPPQHPKGRPAATLPQPVKPAERRTDHSPHRASGRPGGASALGRAPRDTHRRASVFARDRGSSPKRRASAGRRRDKAGLRGLGLRALTPVLHPGKAGLRAALQLRTPSGASGGPGFTRRLDGVFGFSGVSKHAHLRGLAPDRAFCSSPHRFASSGRRFGKAGLRGAALRMLSPRVSRAKRVAGSQCCRDAPRAERPLGQVSPEDWIAFWFWVKRSGISAPSPNLGQ